MKKFSEFIKLLEQQKYNKKYNFSSLILEQEYNNDLSENPHVLAIKQNQDWIVYKVLVPQGIPTKLDLDGYKMQNNIYLVKNKKSDEQFTILVGFSGNKSVLNEKEERLTIRELEEKTDLNLQDLKKKGLSMLDYIIPPFPPSNETMIERTSSGIKINGRLIIERYQLEELESEMKILEVTDDMHLEVCLRLKQLKNCPQTIGGNFVITHCDELIDLSSAPKNIQGDFECSFCNNLKEFNHKFNIIGGKVKILECNSLTSIESLPKKVKGLEIRDCRELNSLKGCPTTVEGSVYIFNCPSLRSIEDLEGMPKNIGGRLYIDRIGFKPKPNEIKLKLGLNIQEDKIKVI